MARQRSEPDHYALKAKAQGKAARSVFKLEEIDRRWRLLRPGHRVLDLGCAPGSWMQYAAERVGAKGVVLGYDLKALNIALPPHAEARVGDVFELTAEQLGGRFNVVLSDMAPSTIGHRSADSLRSAALAESALALAERLLHKGGCVVVKVLEGGEVPAMVTRMRAMYEKVERLRPKATRRESTEVFLIGLRFKGQAPNTEQGDETQGQATQESA